MGLCIIQTDSKFFIKASDVQEAFKAILNIPESDYKYGWGNYSGVQSAESFEEAMEEWRYEISLDEDNNIVECEFNGEKLGIDLVMFKAIAPYVKEDSFIEMNSEDGDNWRYVFKEGKCTEVAPKVSWD